MRALITGSSGFVGTNFRNYLVSHGWEVTPVDITTGYDARAFFRNDKGREKFDLALHCAAVVGGRTVIDGYPLAQAINFELDAAFFRWALGARPNHAVYFSSSAAYPTHLQSPGNTGALAEHLIDLVGIPGLPDQLYGWAKLTGEKLALLAYEDGLNVHVVRPFSGYGSDQPSTYPFPAFIDRALRRDGTFTVWGNGAQTRDFIHIDDIVQAVMKMVEENIPGPVNLGTGRPTSMLELARIVTARAGYSPEFKTFPDKPSGVHWRVADTTRLNKFYEPSVSLESGISRALLSRAGRAM